MEIATGTFCSQLVPKPIPFARPTSSDGSFSEESFNEDEVVDDLDRLNTTNNGSLNDSGMSLIHATFSYDLEDFVYDDCMDASCDCEDGFRSNVARVAQRTCLSVDDEAVQSLMEMFLPLACEEDKETEGLVDDVGNFGTPPQMPLAKLTADDDEQLQSEEEEEESVEEENGQLHERTEDGARADFTGMELVTACHQLSGMEDYNPATSIEGLDPIVHGHSQRSLFWDELQKNKANCRSNTQENLADADAFCSPAVIRQPISENSDEMCIEITRTSSLENRSEGSDKSLAGPITEKSVGKQTVPCEIVSVDATDGVPAEVVNVKDELQSIGRLHMTVSLSSKSKYGQLQVYTKNIYPSNSTLTEVHLKAEAEALSIELMASAAEVQLKPDDNSLVEGIQSERIVAVQEAGHIQEKTDVKESMELMQSQCSNAASMEQDKFNLRMESKLSVADGDAGAKVQDYDTVLSYASDGVDVVDDMARKNIEANIECICSAGHIQEKIDVKENMELMQSQSSPAVSMEQDKFNLHMESKFSVAGRDAGAKVQDHDTVLSNASDGVDAVDYMARKNIEANIERICSAGLSVSTCPAGLGSSVSSLEPDPHSVQDSQKNGSVSSLPSAEDSQCNVDRFDNNEDTQEKLQMIRMKFLRLAHRLGQTSHNVVVAQVLYRLGLAEQLLGARCSEREFAVSYDRVCAIAEEEEAAGQEGLDFTCTILVLGKTGVGKSATINSIFDEAKTATDAFQPATNKIEEIVGTVCGVKVKIIDTPGLIPCFSDKRRNEKILSSVKKFIKKCQPDIVLYCDRLDIQCRDHSEISLMQIITEIFGAAIWFNTTVVLTHSFLAPPDGADGSPISYEMFVAQRSHFVQQSICQAAGDMRLMNPVSLIENHASCRTNRAGEKVLPNGEAWKPQLLLLCFASKILGEANAVLKLQDSIPGRQLGVYSKVPPLPYLLSSLLQSRAGPKIQDEQLGAQVVSDEDLEDLLDLEDGDSYDQLPPFKHLTKYQLSKLSKVQRKAYFDELDYREKLFQKKQWKEEQIRWKNLKSMPRASKDTFKALDENFGEENASAGAVPVPIPDMALPPSFDSDNPTYRYRYFDMASQWLVRPVVEANGWDHDSGFNGLSVEKVFVIGDRIPASVSGQLNKDKKEANIQLECAASLRHPEGKVTLAGFDVQTVGKDQAYTFRGETTFCNLKRNKTAGGFALTVLGDTLAAGMKIEDRLTIGKRLKFVLNGGAMMGHGEVAFGGSLETTLREKDYPIGQMFTTLGFSMMDWHGDLAIGSNLQSQFLLGRKLMMVTNASWNNRGSGHINIRTNSSEQLQIALIGIIPIIRAVIGSRLFNHS